MEAKVYFDRHPQFVVGPLHQRTVDEAIFCKGMPATVLSLDRDGAGVAWSDEWLQTEAEKRSLTLDQMKDTLRSIRTVPNLPTAAEAAAAAEKARKAWKAWRG